jgi:cytochrome c oxidase subunit 2
MAKLQGLLFALATVLLVVLATFYFTGVGAHQVLGRDTWLPSLNSDRGAIDSALSITLLVTGIVFIATNLLLAYFTWRFADRPGAVASYWHDNPRLEWTWTLVTAGIMAIFLFNALGLWAQIQSPAPRDAITVEVTGQQFRWVVRYPGKDGMFGKTDARLASGDNERAYIGMDPSDEHGKDDVVLLNHLYLPQDRPVRILLRSTDVIHSFFLPNFRVKQDAMPGMTVENWFTPRVAPGQAGEFEIACAELCGLGHYKMKGFAHVIPAAGFDEAVVKAAAE